MEFHPSERFCLDPTVAQMFLEDPKGFESEALSWAWPQIRTFTGEPFELLSRHLLCLSGTTFEFDSILEPHFKFQLLEVENYPKYFHFDHSCRITEQQS